MENVAIQAEENLFSILLNQTKFRLQLHCQVDSLRSKLGLIWQDSVDISLRVLLPPWNVDATKYMPCRVVSTKPTSFKQTDRKYSDKKIRFFFKILLSELELSAESDMYVHIAVVFISNSCSYFHGQI